MLLSLTCLATSGVVRVGLMTLWRAPSEFVGLVVRLLFITVSSCASEIFQKVIVTPLTAPRVPHRAVGIEVACNYTPLVQQLVLLSSFGWPASPFPSHLSKISIHYPQHFPCSPSHAHCHCSYVTTAVFGETILREKCPF